MNERDSNSYGFAQQKQHRRLPTVEEAIQYSPFSSIAPFDPNVIPAPSPYPRTSLSNFLTEDQLRASSALLRSWNEEASRPGGPSEKIQARLREVQTLIHADDLTEYIFKRPAGAQPVVRDEQPRPEEQQPLVNHAGLGAFAGLAADSLKLSYRFSTPESIKSSSSPQQAHESGTQQVRTNLAYIPNKTATNSQAFSQNAQTPSLKQTNGQHILSRQPHSEHSTFYISPRAPSAPRSEYQRFPELDAAITNPQTGGNFSVMIPAMPSSSDPSQYEKDPALDAAILKAEEFSLRKRKRNEQEDDDITIDQQQRIQGAVQELQQLLANLFEVADELEPDRHRYFETVLSDQDDALVLSSGVLSRLENLLQNIIKLRAFSNLEIDTLARLQKLCSKSLSYSSGLPVSIPETSDDDRIRSWITNLEAADSSLQASKIILKIMAVGSNDKQLQSEEIVQDLLNNLRHIVEDSLIQVVEQRASSPSSDCLQDADAKSLLLRVLQKSGRVFRYLGDLLLQIDVSETLVTSIESISTKLLFVENATTEKESILGVQKFETLRRQAMDVVAKLFLKHPGQRSYVFDEILSSLEKLPTTKQGVKHFRTSDGKALRVVSALIMQLIQTSTIPSSKNHSSLNNEADGEESNDESMSDAEDDDRSDDESVRRKRSAVRQQASPSPGNGPISELRATFDPLFAGAQKSANYVVTYLVNRALSSTKSGDEPYRQLLDDFTEDFVTVLGSSEFPASELLLRHLLTRLVGIAEGDKSTAPSKNMALDLMGRMGSAIADLRSFTTRTLRTLEESHHGTRSELIQLTEDALDNKPIDWDFLKENGPCHMIVEQLYGRELEDVRIQSARCYNLIQWAQNVSSAEKASLDNTDDNEEQDLTEKISKLATWLLSVVEEPDRLLDQTVPESSNTMQVRLASALLIVNSPLCKALPRILSILVLSMSSNHVTVRNRGLKSVVQVLEKDATILERSRNVLNHIVSATSDASPMVRESALGLLGKCMSLKPELEGQFLKTILAKTTDSGISVRKRAMKLLKEIYVRNHTKEVRAAIADAILVGLEDVENSVQDLARQTIEEIWITPFHGVSPNVEQSVKVKQELESHVQLVIATAQRGEHVLSMLETLFYDALKKEIKGQQATRDMCKVLVALMFDMTIDNDSAPGTPSQPAVLQALTIFAKAEPRLFNSEQMETLRPYIQNLSSSDDLLVYRSVIIIYRCVLPILPPLQHSFLKNVQQVLFSSVSRLGKVEMNEVATCLSIIDGVLKNTDRLANLLISVLTGIEKEKAENISKQSDDKALARLRRYIMIAGYFGKACDVEAYKDGFAQRLTNWKVHTVSGLLTDIVCQFTGSKQADSVREQALESVCLICQSWPKNFLKQNVTGAFTLAFGEGNRVLESVVLSGFKAFYFSEEARAKSRSDENATNGESTGREKLAKSMVLSDNDGASTSIAQQYLSDVIRISLASVDDLALTATELVASINRQGLVHPKESGPAFVALETSPDPIIAKIAFEGHQALHHKHESMLDKEYLKAVEKAFRYQKLTIGKISGVDAFLTPKLRSFYEVLKQGTPGLRKKLLVNLCGKINIDPAKINHQDNLQMHSEYARFVLENLALFEYGRIDELLALLNCVEKIFTTTGNTISQRIESLLNLNMEPGQTEQDTGEGAVNGVAPSELKALTIASVVVTMFWETRGFLRKTWNLPQAKESKQKGPTRDVNKPPTKSSHAPPPDRFLQRFAELSSSSLINGETMMGQCKSFVELLSIDGDLKIDASDEDGLNGSMGRFGTPSEDDALTDGTPAPGSASSTKVSKRKGSASAASTPRKRGRPGGSDRRKSSLGFGGAVKWDDDEAGWD